MKEEWARLGHGTVGRRRTWWWKLLGIRRVLVVDGVDCIVDRAKCSKKEAIVFWWVGVGKGDKVEIVSMVVVGP